MNQAHDKVAFTVVCFLGTAALLFGSGVIFLVFKTIGYETIDPSTVALVSGVSTLAGAAMGALGSILASTGKGAPQPVVVEQPANNPIPTTDSPPADAPHPDAPEASDL